MDTDAPQGVLMGAYASISRRRLLAYALAAGALTASGAGCGSRTSSVAVTPARGRRQRLTLSWQIDTGYPSPFAFSSLGPGGIVKQSMLFDSLLWKDQNGLIPWLAATREMQSDGRSVTFKLRPDVAWHDGRPFTAEDVAFSFTYYAAHPFSGADTSVVESAVATDPRTATIRLTRPFAPFLHDIAGVVPMIPRHVWTDIGDPLKFSGAGAVVGTGPFTFGEYAEGQGAYLFRANDTHFAGRPVVDELRYALVPLEQQPLALRAGTIDGALATAFDVQAEFQSGRYRVLATQPFSTVRLAFNVDRPPFDRQLFRQAIALALDRRAIGQRVTHGDVVVGHPGVIPPESPWFSSDVMQYPYDVARANAMLDGLGYVRAPGSQLRQSGQGTPLRIQLLADPDAAESGLIQSMLAQAGVGVDIVTTDPKTRTERLKKLDYQLALLAHIGVGGDPDFLRLWYAGRESNGFAQGNVLHDDEFTRIADEQATELDVGKRHALVARLQRILSEQLPTLTLYHRRFYWIYDPSACDRYFNTWAGIMTGIPLADNKLALLGP